jgi:hypothetical protein
MAESGLPDMTFIRREIRILDVAVALGIRIAGRNTAHCWRDGHKNGDRTPSLSLHRNRAKCFVCDVDSLSVIDLVLKHQECSLHEAVAWICGRWTVPTIAKNRKLSRPERWKTSPVGFSAFPLEDLVRSGFWATLDDAARAILPVLFCFTEKGEAAISYRGLARYSGKSSDSTIAKVLRHLEQIGLLKPLPKTIGNFREVRRYRLTLDSSEFQTLLRTIHEHTKAERDAERQLRSELRKSTPTQNPETHAYPGTTYSSTVKCEQTAHSTVAKGAIEELPAELPLALKAKAWANRSIPRKPCVESTATWQTPHFTVVEREEAELLHRVAAEPILVRMQAKFGAKVRAITNMREAAS